MTQEARKAQSLFDVLLAVMILAIIILGLIVMAMALSMAFLELASSMALMLANCRT